MESIEAVQALEGLLNFTVGVFIKIDAGYHRTGVYSNDYDRIRKIIQEVEKIAELEFKGFLQHAGHTYHVQDSSEVEEIHQSTLAEMHMLKKEFSSDYPELIISVGDTPTCSICEDFATVDEMRPGNFIFYDAMQHKIGSCNRAEIAVLMACPVVAKHPDREELIVYGGAVHFSKDHLIDNKGKKIFGFIAAPLDPWNKNIEDCHIKKLSQEHGTIYMRAERMKNIKLGDIIYFTPIHSCLTANLMNSYLTTDGQRLSMFRYQ